MRKIMKLTGVVVAFAMLVSVAMSTTIGTWTRFPPHVWEKDEISIGFFNFVQYSGDNHRATHLEIRTTKIPASFGIALPYTLDGITRLRETSLNDDALGGPAAGASTSTVIVFAGAVTEDYGFKPTEAATIAQVDGTGTITFGEGEFAIVWTDGTTSTYDLSGVVLSNLIDYISPGSPTSSTTTVRLQSTTRTTNPSNPPTGVVTAVIPAILAAAAAIMVSRRRR